MVDWAYSTNSVTDKLYVCKRTIPTYLTQYKFQIYKMTTKTPDTINRFFFSLTRGMQVDITGVSATRAQYTIQCTRLVHDALVSIYSIDLQNTHTAVSNSARARECVCVCVCVGVGVGVCVCVCCLLYTSPSPRDCIVSRMPSSA